MFKGKMHQEKFVAECCQILKIRLLENSFFQCEILFGRRKIDDKIINIS